MFGKVLLVLRCEHCWPTGTGLLLYDHLLTFPNEIGLIWQQKFSLLSWLYILNYYPLVLCYLLQCFQDMYTQEVRFRLWVVKYDGLLQWTVCSYQFHWRCMLNYYSCTAVMQFATYVGLLSSLANTGNTFQVLFECWLLSWAAFQITRTYALWNQSWLIASCLLLLNLPTIVLNFVSCVPNISSPFIWSLCICSGVILSALVLALQVMHLH